MGIVGRIANRAKDLGFVPGAERWWVDKLKGRVLCLLYHRVGDGGADYLSRGGSPLISTGEFFSDLKFLSGLGARFLTFADLRTGIWPGPGEVGVIVSFDDGFRCTLHHGREVLETLGIRGVFFQTTEYLGGNVLNWEHALYWLAGREPARLVLSRIAGARSNSAPEDPAAVVPWLRETCHPVLIDQIIDQAQEELGCEEDMSAEAAAIYPGHDELRRCAAAGHEIGSHGHHHYKRANIDERIFEAELVESKDILGRIIDVPVEIFSYPFGSVLPGDDAICGRHYRQAATVEGRAIDAGENPLRLPRCTWPGQARNRLRKTRWLLTGHI